MPKRNGIKDVWTVWLAWPIDVLDWQVLVRGLFVSSLI
jgi:hypothetical protein